MILSSKSSTSNTNRHPPPDPETLLRPHLPTSVNAEVEPVTQISPEPLVYLLLLSYSTFHPQFVH